MSIHVIGNVLYIKHVAENVSFELYRYFIDKELQRGDDSIFCLTAIIFFRAWQEFVTVFEYPHWIEATTDILCHSMIVVPL